MPCYIYIYIYYSPNEKLLNQIGNELNPGYELVCEHQYMYIYLIISYNSFKFRLVTLFFFFIIFRNPVILLNV